jgi:hypothetical protein
MNVIMLRLILAGLLITSVASKFNVSVDYNRYIGSAVTKVLEQHGLKAQADLSNARATIQVHAPGCDGAIEVVPININLQNTPLFDAVLDPGYVKMFVYLDRTWLAEDRLGMRLVWLKNKPLFMLGLGRFVAIATALLIAETPGCHIAETIDWSLVWDRSTMAAVRLPQ